jgi:hypothetical protein
MDLPPQERPYDRDDAALVTAFVVSNERGFVAFKDPTSPRVAGTARIEAASAWRPERLVKKGTRAAVSAAAITIGLQELASRGVQVLGYYDAIGVAHVVMSPQMAPTVRSLSTVDYVEPELSSRRGSDSFSSRAWLRGMLSGDSIPWGLDSVHAPAVWSTTTGSGAKLLFIDTGHQANHSDLPSVPSGNCYGFYGGCDDTLPKPHGTWVSGVAVALGISQGVVGMAPGIAASGVYYWGACDNTDSIVCYTAQIDSALN